MLARPPALVVYSTTFMDTATRGTIFDHVENGGTVLFCASRGVDCIGNE